MTQRYRKHIIREIIAVHCSNTFIKKGSSQGYLTVKQKKNLATRWGVCLSCCITVCRVSQRSGFPGNPRLLKIPYSKLSPWTVRSLA